MVTEKGKVNLVLPVMIQDDKEVAAFLQAKERIERLGDKYSFPVEVGIFLNFLPGFTRKPGAFEQQLANQERYRLPIRLVETGIQRNNSLSYVPGDPTYKPGVASDLERTIEQAARLRDLDPKPLDNLVIAPHVGVMVNARIPRGNFNEPAFYSVQDFVERRDFLYQNIKQRFEELDKLAKSHGLKLGLENAYLGVVEDFSFWQRREEGKDLKGKAHDVGYQAFNDFPSLNDISGGNLVFDVNHYSAMVNLPRQFEANHDILSPEALFATMGISSWGGYFDRVGSVEDYVSRSHALHISQVNGIAVRIKKGELDVEGRDAYSRWCPEKNLISNSVYLAYLVRARERSWPVSVEEDYGLKPLNFEEADRFLEPILGNH